MQLLTEETRTNAEMSVAAETASAKASIESAYMVAIHRPRSVPQCRQKILEACKDPRFAADAIYEKPVSSTKSITGPSIRFAEMALQSWGNVRISSKTIFEDVDYRKIYIEVLDLETNTSYGKEVALRKVVERSFLRDGMEVISTRKNSKGKTVHVVRAEESDLADKTAALESKVIRNSALRLIPQDIIHEAESQCHETSIEDIKRNIKVHIKSIVDRFAEIGITVKDIENHLGRQMNGVTPKELTDLRKIYAAIRDGEARYADFFGAAKQEKRPTVNIEDLKSAPPTPPVETPAPTVAAPEAPKRRGRPAKKKAAVKPNPEPVREPERVFTQKTGVNTQESPFLEKTADGAPDDEALPFEAPPVDNSADEQSTPKPEQAPTETEQTSAPNEQAPEETEEYVATGIYKGLAKYEEMIKEWDGRALVKTWKKYYDREPPEGCTTGYMAEKILIAKGVDADKQRRAEARLATKEAKNKAERDKKKAFMEGKSKAKPEDAVEALESAAAEDVAGDAAEEVLPDPEPPSEELKPKAPPTEEQWENMSSLEKAENLAVGVDDITDEILQNRCREALKLLDGDQKDELAGDLFIESVDYLEDKNVGAHHLRRAVLGVVDILKAQ